MSFFADPDGNALMLHHRYAPRDRDELTCAASRLTPRPPAADVKPPPGAPTSVNVRAPCSAPTAAASSTDRPAARPNVKPAANESPQP